jgi:beta-RFAP synthase
MIENSGKINLKSKHVSVRAQARLHLGFLDMCGDLGRKFGSIGLSITNIETSITARYAHDIDISGIYIERAENYAEQILSHFGIDGGVELSVHSAIPEHAGLGSGTQLSLAIASAICHLYGLPEQKASYLATILHRGARSGVGVGTFTHGGFVVDGGRGEKTEIPPIITRLSFPDHWRIILIFDDEEKGINGVKERRVFSQLPKMKKEVSDSLCRLTMIKALPAIMEQDCSEFGAAVTEIQNIIGDYFSSIQGGRYTSPFLKSIIETMSNEGATGVGQSSWGPTGFAIFPNETIAFQVLKKLRDKWKGEPRLRFLLCEGHNQGAKISIGEKKPFIKNENIKVENL